MDGGGPVSGEDQWMGGPVGEEDQWVRSACG